MPKSRPARKRRALRPFATDPRTVTALACAVLAGPAAGVASADVLDDLNKKPWTSNSGGGVLGMGILDARTWGLAGTRGKFATAFVLDGKIELGHREFTGGTRARWIRPLNRTAAQDATDPASDHAHPAASVVAGNYVGLSPESPLIALDPDAAFNRMFKVPGTSTEGNVPTPQPGDVILIERSVVTSLWADGKNREVPIEVYGAEGNQISRREIRAASDLGVIVVEPAGNGYTPSGAPWDGSDLDAVVSTSNPEWQDEIAAGLGPWKGFFSYDSGAIIAGAGGAIPSPDGLCYSGGPARSRESYSTYGSRVDVQAPGSCTPGAARASNTGAPYTVGGHKYGRFGGTSGASAVIAGFAAAASSAYEGWEGATGPATPDAIRQAMRRSVSPQVPESGQSSVTKKIGGLPDMPRTLNELAYAPATNTPAAPTTTPEGRQRFTLSSPTSNVTFQCRVIPATLPTFEQLKANPLPTWKTCATTYTHDRVLAEGTWRFQVRAVGAGTGAMFDPTPAARDFTVSGKTSVSRDTSINGLVAWAPGRGGSMLMTDNGTTKVRVTDDRGVNAGSGCTQVNATTADCDRAGLNALWLMGGEAKDILRTTSTVTANLIGGGGDDLLTGGTKYDSIEGGAGNDAISTGGDGIADAITCGSGTDSITKDAIDTLRDPAACENVTIL